MSIVGGQRRYLDAATLLLTVAASRAEEIARSLGRVPGDTLGVSAAAAPAVVGRVGRRIGGCAGHAVVTGGTALRDVADRLEHFRRS